MTARETTLTDQQKDLLARFPEAREALNQMQQRLVRRRRYWRRVAVISLLGTVAVAGLVVWAVLASTISGIKASAPFQDAMRRASADPRLIASLGQPIESGWMIGGSTLTNGNVSASELRIPISGPKGRGILHVAGTRPPASRWQYQQLTAELPGGRRVDLLKADRAQ